MCPALGHNVVPPMILVMDKWLHPSLITLTPHDFYYYATMYVDLDMIPNFFETLVSFFRKSKL